MIVEERHARVYTTENAGYVDGESIFGLLRPAIRQLASANTRTLGSTSAFEIWYKKLFEELLQLFEDRTVLVKLINGVLAESVQS